MKNLDSNPQSNEAKTPLWGIGILILAVVGLNLAILGYAVQTATHHPEDDAAAHSVEPAPSKEAPSAAPAQSEAPVLVAQVDSPPPAAQPQVVNTIHLPDRSVIQGLYVQHCAACHGLDGRGDGPAADQLYPRPRDFVESPFRFAPQGGGEQVLIEAIERSISLGVPRSSMPGFKGVLTESEIAGLARYTVALRAESTAQPAVVASFDVGSQPPTTPGLISRGKELYVSLGCVACHGESGHGDGPSSRGLVDSVRRPVRPADLTTGLFKGGQTPEDLARVILAGIPGTPMAAFEPALVKQNPDGSKNLTDAWALVAYIGSLSPKTRPVGEGSGARLAVLETDDDDLPFDPTHIGWLGVPPTEIEIKPIWQREETTTHVTVKAVRNESHLSLCLEWRDGTMDLGRDHSVFPDGVAVMFALGAEVPALPMGIEVPGFAPKAPVNIWHWQADRQIAASNGSSTGADEGEKPTKWRLFPLTAEARANPPALQVVAPTPDSPPTLPTFDTAQDSGNVARQLLALSHSVLESNAEGFGTLTPQPVSDQEVWGAAAWSLGVWRVVMVRNVAPSGSLDIDLNRVEAIPITLAVWDGAKGDRAGVKKVSGWHWLEPRTSPPAATEQTEN